MIACRWDALDTFQASVTFHADTLSQSDTENNCDILNCESFPSGGVFDPLPQFGLVGKTVLTAEISYNVSSKNGAIAINGTDSTINVFALLFTEVGFNFGNSIPTLFSDTAHGSGGGGGLVEPGKSETISGALHR